MHSKLAKVATDWWIEQMKLRCRHTYPDKITGDNSSLVIIDDSFAEELARFEEVLFEEIHTCIDKRIYIHLTCCSFPNRDLSKLAQKAHISKTYFPLRAEMQIFGNSINVSLNGGELHKLVLPTE